MRFFKWSAGEAAKINASKPTMRAQNAKVIALAGNPNVGKSTVFNALTGMNQHTGNWAGKTVANAQGMYTYRNEDFVVVDMPGTYSLLSNSVEEEIARDFICFANPDLTVVVVDATCLERNLNLVLQILEITGRVVVCVNLMDEAEKKHIQIDLDRLSGLLGVPVVGTSARAKQGIDDLSEQIYRSAFKAEETERFELKYSAIIEDAIAILYPSVSEITDKTDPRWVSIKLLDSDDTLSRSLDAHLGFDITADAAMQAKMQQARQLLLAAGLETESLRDTMVSQIVATAEEIYGECVTAQRASCHARDRMLDRIFTARLTGIPIMLLFMGIIFWLTVTGANYPSSLLADGLFWIEAKLYILFEWLGAPWWVTGLFVSGMYRTLAWVVSVMLPPMAIFFPLFTLLEDAGYLPRIAFNMDKFFKKACAHGKQALTMCMGFGCNACGVVGCRIIDSPRERLIAMLTNNFVPCNGRFPTLIAIITMFFSGTVSNMILKSTVSTLMLTAVVVLGVVMTLLISKLLSKTILKGLPSSFALELPPYRRPQVGKVIVRSVMDRTLYVLGRAVCAAAPAGLVIWLMSNVTVADVSLLYYCTNFLDPFARLLGLDGVILMAFILGFPANEIVMPIIIMSYLSMGSMAEFDDLSQLFGLLSENGWTWITAVCTMLFSLMHFPCATTCWTIKKETQSLKWTVLAFAIPTVTGIAVCFIVANLCRLATLFLK